VNAPLPVLVVEIVSGTTRRRDNTQKRALYLEAGVAEYWIVSAEEKSVRVVRPLMADVTVTDTLNWTPEGATAVLSIPLDALFAGTSGADD
jgi:Uma2 family endonuclease